MVVPAKLRDLDFVRICIDTAKEFAEEKGVALTIERIAVCLGVSRLWILDLISLTDDKLTKREREVREMLSVALEEVAAQNIEYSMRKGSSTLSTLMLKNNHGYSDKGRGSEKDSAGSAEDLAGGIEVVFIGEGDILD